LFAAITKDNGVSEDGIERALALGVSPNARGGRVVVAHGRVREIEEFAIVYAIQEANGVAVQKLVQAGANLDVRCNRGFSLIDTAMIRGEAACVRPLLEASPGLVGAASHYGGNLLHMAVLMFSSYFLIESFEVEDRQDADEKMHWQKYYRGDLTKSEVEPVVEDRAFVSAGNLPLIQMLVDLNPGLIVAKSMKGVSPLDIVRNPRKYIEFFCHVGGFCTTESLSRVKYSSDTRAWFSVTVCNREDREPMRASIHLDFSKVQKLFEQKARQLNYLSTGGAASASAAPVVDADQLQGLSRQVADVCRRADSAGERAKGLTLEVDPKHPYCQAIGALHKKSRYRELFYDVVSMGLFVNLGIDLLRLEEQFQSDIHKYKSSVNIFRFSTPANLEQGEFNLFMKVVSPENLLGYCQEVSLYLTEAAFGRLNQLRSAVDIIRDPSDLSQIPLDQRKELLLELANLTIMQAIAGTSVPANGLNIDESLSLLGNKQLLINDVVHWVCYGTRWSERIVDCIPAKSREILFSFKTSKDDDQRSDFNITRRLSTADVESENHLRSYLFDTLQLPKEAPHKPNGRMNGHHKMNGIKQQSSDDGQHAKRKGGCVVQ